MMFTPPCSSKRSFPPRQLETLPALHSTGFGCLELVKFRLSGDFIFPPMANRAKFNKYDSGPVIEAGLYALLLQLKSLNKLTCGFTPLVAARLRAVVTPAQFANQRLSLHQLSLGWEESLEIEELEALAHLSPHLKELKGVSVGILDDQYRGQRHLQDGVMCNFLKSFSNLERLSSNLKLTCLNSFLVVSGSRLTSLTCSTLVLSTKDLLVMRRHCINLERLEGRFSVDNTVDRAEGDYHTDHCQEYRDLATLSVCIDSPWSEWKAEIAKIPWQSLKYLDLNGRLSAKVMQILVANADLLETVSITNWPNEMVSGGMAFDDSWISALTTANSLPNIKELTLRMDSDHYVEEGFLTKSSLSELLSHAVLHCPRLKTVVGEWTRVPDKEISQLEEDCARKGLSVKVRNAEPYREFQNQEDNDRYYGMNEGYWRNQAINPINLDNNPGQAVQVQATTGDEIQFRHKRHWGYIYRPYYSELSEDLS